MSSEDENPHLLREMPGSWNVPFKRWVLGVCVALLLLAWGLEDILRAACTIPVWQGKYSRVAWLALEGAGARWFGFVQIGCAICLHARYFWRFHRGWWRYYEMVQNGGLGLAAASLTITYIFLWRAHF